MNTKRVLIVDDDSGIRGLLRAVLSRGGYEVDEAADGALGLEAIGKSSYDAIILDLRVRNEIRRLKAAGPPPRGGYRAQVLDTVAKVTGWEEGEALDRWLRRNRG